MATHKKPTKEELQEQIKENQKKIDEEIKDPTPTPSEEDPEPSTPPEPSPSQPAPSPSPSAPPDPEPSKPPEPEPSQEDKEKTRLREQYKGSTREAIVQKTVRDNLAKAIETADGIPEPTEEEMIAEYPDWDVMSETERKLAKKVIISDKRFTIINTANKESKDLDNWIKKVEDFSTDPKTLVTYPELEGKAVDFRAYSITPQRRDQPLEDLIKGFLYDANKQPPKKKGQMFEKPGGGNSQSEPIVAKYSPQEAETIRKKSFVEYRAYLKKHEKEIKSGASIS